MLKRHVLVNSATALITSFLTILAGFLLQKELVTSLGAANLGLSSVFTNIVSLLSLAEMGISTSIIYHLYAPISQGDQTRIRSLMTLYARAYRLIALIVLLLGLGTLPFVHIFLKDSPFSLSYIRLVFLLFLARTVCSYLLSYRRSLILADQKTHIVSLVDFGTQLLSIITGIVLLRLTASFVVYLASQIFFTLLNNLIIALIVARLYPYMKGHRSDNVSPELRKTVLKDVKDVFIMKLSGTILNSTDSVIISSFIGVVSSGLYDNYNKITAALLTLVTGVTGAIQPTLGHLYSSEDHASLDGTLRSLTFIFYLFGSFCAVATFCLITPFITEVWIGEGFALELPVVALLAGNFFLITLRNPLWSLLGVSGLFNRDKNISILGTVSNLIISLALVKPLGMAGVFIGTLVSQSLQLVFKARLIYRAGIGRSPRRYALEFAEYSLLFLFSAALLYYLTGLISFKPALLCLVVRGLVCLAFCAGLNTLIFARTERWKSCWSSIRGMLKKET